MRPRSGKEYEKVNRILLQHGVEVRIIKIRINVIRKFYIFNNKNIKQNHNYKNMLCSYTSDCIKNTRNISENVEIMNILYRKIRKKIDNKTDGRYFLCRLIWSSTYFC